MDKSKDFTKVLEGLKAAENMLNHIITPEILEKMTTGQVDFLMFKPFRMEELHHIVQSFLVNNSSERDTTKINKGVYSTSV